MNQSLKFVWGGRLEHYDIDLDIILHNVVLYELLLSLHLLIFLHQVSILLVLNNALIIVLYLIYIGYFFVFL